MKNLEERIKNKIKAPIEECGYSIYDVEYVKEGKDYHLKIFIEKNDGVITIEDCEKVNDIINPILDEEDIIKEQYYLEVSSTGIEKNLKKLEHYEKAIGENVQVKLFKKEQDGKKELQGILKKVKPNEITIEKDGKNMNINMNNIAQAKTIYNWEEIK